MAASFAICAAQGRLREFLIEGEITALQGHLTGQVMDLEGKLGDILPYMADADRKPPDEDGRLKEEIRDLCYQVEDVLDGLALKIASSRTRRSTAGTFKGVAERCMPCCIIHDEAADVAQHLEVVEAQMDALIQRVGSLTQHSPSSGLRQTTTDDEDEGDFDFGSRFIADVTRRVSDREPIGIDDEVRDIVNLLVNGERESQQVIFLVGPRSWDMTTLAQIVYKHRQIRDFFERFAWVTVSEMYGTMSVFKSLLGQLGKEIINNQFEDDTKIAQELFQVLRSKKCLIVLDDLVSFQVWETLRFAFAYQETNSKVLVTTLSSASDFQPLVQGNGWLIRSMQPLSAKDSRKLFRRTAFPRPERLREDDKQEMEDIGEKIIDLYRGQPLVLKTLANLLASKSLSYWERAYNNIESYRKLGESGGSMEVLNVGYDILPYYLKPLFSYMATFPGNSEIEVEKLFQLWMAEGILRLPSREREENWISIGLDCLLDLSSKSMVNLQRDEVSLIRIYESCSLDKVTHQFCSSKLSESRFLEVMDLRRYSNTPPSPQDFPSLTRETRRLALYLDQYEDEYLVDRQKELLRALEIARADYLRTLLFINVNRHQQCILWPEEILNLENIRFLRVLGFVGCSFQTRALPKGIENLLLLKYFSVRGCYLEELPSCIGNLLYLETLDLQVTTSCKVTIPDILCKLERLMHLYLLISFEAKGGGKLRFAELKKLQILKNFDTSVCHLRHLFKLNNIQILDAITSGNDEDLKEITWLIKGPPSHELELAIDVRNFDCYSRKRQDVITELFSCEGPHTLRINGRIGELPGTMDFNRVNKLSFHGSELVLDPMEKLGSLNNLKVLELSENAFVGKNMFCPRWSFPELRRLQLSGLQNLETLTIEEEALSNLTTLAIERCKRLKVSQGLRDLHKDEKLNVAGMPIEFENRLREVEQKSETSAMMATRDEMLYPEANHQYSTG